MVVQLGLNGAIGTGTFIGAQSAVDLLTSIENVIGSRGNDTIVGNEVANTLEDATVRTRSTGFGNDVLIGGIGSDTASMSVTTPIRFECGTDIIRSGSVPLTAAIRARA